MQKIVALAFTRILYFNLFSGIIISQNNRDICIKICSEILEELITTSKLEERNLVFELRAYAKEKLGFVEEEEKNLCLKDFLTAYYVTEFYDGEEKAQNLKKHIEEVYGWQFIE